jgi:hypothetical protein
VVPYGTTLFSQPLENGAIGVLDANAMATAMRYPDCVKLLRQSVLRGMVRPAGHACCLPDVAIGDVVNPDRRHVLLGDQLQPVGKCLLLPPRIGELQLAFGPDIHWGPFDLPSSQNRSAAPAATADHAEQPVTVS